MKVLVLPKYDQNGASSRYRSYNYLPYFDENKITYKFKPLLGKSYINELYKRRKLLVLLQQIFGVFKRVYFLLFTSEKYNLIIIEKELFPNFPYFFEKFLLHGKRYTLDFDDYIAADYKINFIKRIFLKNKIDRLSQRAVFVTVGNHWYFQEIKSENLLYLPTVINLDKYKNIKENHAAEIVTIVWIGSPSTSHYLNIIAPVLSELAERYTIALKIIGAEFKLENVEVIQVPWNADTEVEELEGANIGIMPLDNGLWENGKCGFKLIQYMACGLPVIASSSPANEEIIEHGLNGYIAKSEADWYILLETLIRDEQLRKLIGEKARKKIEQNYSYQVWGNKYIDIILNAQS